MRCLKVRLWSDELHGLSHLLSQRWNTPKDGKSSWLAVWLAISTPSRCNGIVHNSPGPCVTFLKLDGFLIYCTFPHGYVSEFDKKKIKIKKNKGGSKDRYKKAKCMLVTEQFPRYFSWVNSSWSNKAICNNNNMCWSKMFKVIQHIYIMPSSGWVGASLPGSKHQHLNVCFELIGPETALLFFSFVIYENDEKHSSKCLMDRVCILHI